MVQHFSHLQGIHPAVQELYHQCTRDSQVNQPSNLQLENILNVIIQQLPSGYIVLDALDECNAREDKHYVLKWLMDISAKISIAVTSRHFPEDQPANTVLRIIPLDSSQSSIDQDISIFLENQIQISSHFKGTLKDQILDTLRAKAHGQ